MLGLRAAKQDLSGCVAAAQDERVLITNHGKPAAILIGVQGYDMDDILRMVDPSFWKMIARRRKQRTYSHEEVVRELFGSQRKPGKRVKPGRRRAG
jgi:prevent-host-death family protein